MIDSDIEEVVEKGREFENYLEQRGVWPDWGTGEDFSLGKLH
jgi:hypothetical protein